MPSPHTARRRRIWIVDDSPTDAARARAAFPEDWEVQTFADGSAAIEALESGSAPDVILLDWLMPGITGIDVCRYLRANRPDLQIAIVLVTAYGRTEQVVEALEAGANDYVSKPFIDEELRARVEAQVRMHELLERAESAEARTREVLENAPDALVEVDEHCRIRYANPEAGRVFGRLASALVGIRLDDLEPGLESACLGSGPADEGRFPRDVTIAERIYSPSIRSASAARRRLRTIALRDVTEQRRADARRLDFYSIIAHDLRSPLVSIQLRTDAILRGRRGILPAELIADMHRIQGNIRSMVTMIDDFLDLAKLEVAAYRIERQPLDLRELVHTAVEDFRPLADASSLSIAIDAPEPLPLQGDRSRLLQVLNNLIGNAIKFTPAGGSVRVRLQQRGDRAWCAVEDTGRGIEKEALSRIFERFTRAIDAGHEVVGSGLGLMIVREILQAHGGMVGVESETGRGSTFWFELPLAPEAQVSSSM